MKKFYLVLAAVLMVSGLTAQRAQTQHDFNKMYTPATEQEASQARRQGMDLIELRQDRGGAIFFSEDFANGLDGNNGFGGWTIEDTGGNSIWMVADGNSPAGEFSTNIGALASTTADNGWVIFDADAFNTPVADGVEDTEGWIASPSMDMGGLESVIVEWEQYFRYCCFPFAPVFLEVSIDGGATWVTFPAHGDFIESANVASANPLPTAVDISCVAAGESDVTIRFSYLQNPITGNGYSHYYWGIDDIAIYELESVNDMAITQVSTGDIFNYFEYSKVPMEQAFQAADGGLTAGVIYRNAGSADQTNVVITVDVLDATDAVVATVSSDAFTAPSAANAEDCPANLQDTLYLETGFVPTEMEIYTVRATLSQDEDDETADNNVRSRDIEFTADEYAHEVEAEWDTEFTPRVADSGDFEPTGYGNFYLAPNEGTMAYGALVAFGPNTASGPDEFIEFELRFYTLEPGVALNDAGYEVAFHNTVPEWVPTSIENAELVYFPFEEEIPMETSNPTDGFDNDVFHFVGIINDFESELELTVVGTANTDTDNSTGAYQQAGDGSFIWFTSQTASPAVHLITSARVGVDELANLNGIDVKQNVPNPASNSTMIELFLVSPRTVSFEVRDLAGRLIEQRDMGTLPSGETRVELNVSDYNAGIYNYTFVVDGVRLTKKMMVTK